MEETISLQDIFEILKKRWMLILASFFIAIGLTSIVTFFVMTPKYQASTQLTVTLPTNENGASVNDVNFNLQMMNTYKDFITQAQIVAEDARGRLEKSDGYTGSYKDIQNMIEVGQSPNSQMFEIKATSSQPELAMKVANTMTESFKEKAQETLSVDKISVLSEATLPRHAVSPNKKLNLLIGAVLGMMVGVGLAFILEMTDKTVKDERFIRETLELPVLGKVPQMTSQELSAKMVSNLPSNDQLSNSETGSGRRSRRRV
ncbi:YveK family protein [Vagococcus lutrae]|uniref:YveK family protein n=1 Tax=Vagococcus lutrae TaxID=81947 RepID=UPI0020100C82|nr:Wzz/FepE/Etk N-terminal domain-containing protein [Vagococcus lutrae]MDT2823853.1 Wzz/FepE/Etk N-terminal domain-containing protein [Vagococcus lutrae]UQF18040.1 Wzz/FepE/Etk N-terminal domain-containing protein [Vagococcus lutrae]